MDLFTADVSERSARHKRRMEISSYNAQVDQINRDNAAEMIRIKTEAESDLADQQGLDLETKIGSSQQAAFSGKGVAYDLAKGNYSKEKLLDTITMGAKTGATKTGEASRVAKQMETIGNSEGSVLSTDPAFNNKVGGERLAPKPVIAGIEASPELSKGGKALNMSKAVGKKVGVGIIRHSGAAMNIGFGTMDLIEDIDAGEVVGENMTEKAANVLQIGSGLAEIGSLGVAGAVGLGILGTAVAPVAVGLGVLGAAAGVASAVTEAAGVIEESQEDEERITSQADKDIQKIADTPAPEKMEVGTSAQVRGGFAPKLRG